MKKTIRALSYLIIKKYKAMIRKFKFLFIVQIIILSFTSCSSDDSGMSLNNSPELNNLVNLSSLEYVSIAFDEPKELSETDAEIVAVNFITASQEKEDFAGYNTKTVNPQLKLKSKFYAENKNVIATKKASTKEISVPIYEFYIEGKEKNEDGLIVVSGDERAPKVIGYIPNINDNSQTLSTTNYLLELSKLSLLEDVLFIERVKDSLRLSTREKIAQELNIDVNKINFEDIKKYLAIESEPLSKAKPIQYPPTQILSYVTPMCTTQWNQTSPYNNKLPIGNVEGYSSATNYYAGCGVIAVSQLIAFLEPTITANDININWSLLKERTYISNSDSEQKKNMMGYFIKKIYEETKAYPNFNSSGYVTSVSTTESNLEKVIKNYSTCSSRLGWNPDVVRNSLLANCPILTMGQGTRTNGEKVGHAFIVDGYMMCRMNVGGQYLSLDTKTKELVKIYDLYFRANLGWGGSSDGYFLLNKDASVDFETGGTIYKSNDLNIVPNIRKK